ncbi:MAG TPA: sigma-70 family RNA polymerase sigma factor [Thermoanaerobaculia bacterium]|nr:sigma-70 family RNA polymerase sigma factor [Thermoanaerobaculia bacterium]
MNDDPREARLIARAQQGDGEAYGVLVSEYLRRVVAIAFSIVRNGHDAEDLAQEAFVKAYQSIGRFRAGAAFGPWIGRIVTNLALDVVKHRTKFRHDAIDDTHRATRRDDAELPAMQSDLASRIDAALDELPDMQRIVARLHLVEEMEQAEIAAVLGLSAGTVRSHLSLARTKLKARLADLYD